MLRRLYPNIMEPKTAKGITTKIFENSPIWQIVYGHYKIQLGTKTSIMNLPFARGFFRSLIRSLGIESEA